MTQKLFVLLLGVVLAATVTTPAAAANKEHQQLMADIRMLQEQSQILQNLLTALTEVVKTLSVHLDDRFDRQGTAVTKGFADQKLILDTIASESRVIRERLDDNNVRIGTLTQEVEALRGALQRPTPTITDADPTATAPIPGGTPGAGAAQPVAGVSPQKMQEAAQGDYASGQYDLAIEGFQAYIKNFPRSDWADDAQLMICKSYLNDGKNDKAVEACDGVIRNYPSANSVAEAYYRKGLALSNLRDVAGARAACETIVKDYKDSDVATLAQQCLDRLKRP
jgi:TolA-binding protein